MIPRRQRDVTRQSERCSWAGFKASKAPGKTILMVLFGGRAGHQGVLSTMTPDGRSSGVPYLERGLTAPMACAETRCIPGSPST